MRALAVLLMLALCAPALAQEKKKAEPKKSEQKKAAPKKAEKKAEKKAAEPKQDWGRFNQGSKKDLDQIEKQKAAKK